jgi:hypothetical protein
MGYYLSLRWSFELMNTKDFLRLVLLRWASAGQDVPLGGATRRAADLVAQFILGGGANRCGLFMPQ